MFFIKSQEGLNQEISIGVVVFGYVCLTVSELDVAGCIKRQDSGLGSVVTCDTVGLIPSVHSLSLCTLEQYALPSPY